MLLYLLVKEHNLTGLKYLCKKSAHSFDECVKYKGSGTYWKKHLAKHGNDVSTTCLFVTEDKQEFKKIATKYSKEYDIVNSKQWANLTIEEGQGGNTVVDLKLHKEKTSFGIKHSKNYSKHLDFLKEHIKIIQPLAAKAAKEKMTGVPKTEQHKQNMRGKRPHVNQTGSNNNFAKKIETPFGVFGSIREASNKIKGYTYKMIWYKLHNDTQWRYLKSQ
jgi:hypothetical protein